MQTPTSPEPVRPRLSSRSVSRRGFQRGSGTGGFTMLELMVVLGILALLAGLAISNVGKIFDDSKDSTARLFVNQSLTGPLFAYNLKMSGYPTTAEGLQALIVAPADKADKWNGPYLEPAKIPIDPWGEPYQYMSPGAHNKSKYDVWSKGPDKITGNEDDIGNWETTAAPAAAK